MLDPNLENHTYTFEKAFNQEKQANIDQTVTGDTVGSKADTAQGSNRQSEALLDFLAVYSTTQSKGSGETANGYWDDLGIKNANSDQIREALFGDGSQTNGLVNAKSVLLGGESAPIGAMLTASSLKDFMDGKGSEVFYAPWVVPLQTAMAEFNINTPQRIAAFLAQVRNETNGLTLLKESTGKRNFSALISRWSLPPKASP